MKYTSAIIVAKMKVIYIDAVNVTKNSVKNTDFPRIMNVVRGEKP